MTAPRELACALLLVAACGGREAPPTATAPRPIENAATAPTEAAPACLPASARIAGARLADGGIVACYIVPVQSGEAQDCWRVDFAASAWRFATREPYAEGAEPPRSVTATATSASVCAPDGGDCKTIPLSGIKVGPDDELSGATNSDRSIVAVWASSGPVHVFDASGKRLATIKPWPTEMSDGGPSVFREAHVLGRTIEVRIVDTPVSTAIRLYDARGKKIADVFGGQPMQDTPPPIALGGSRYGFIVLEPRLLVIADVATGKQLGSYPIPGQPTAPDALLGTPEGNVTGVIETTAMLLDVASGKLTAVPAPACPE